ncbi:glycosyltransferase family 2 protein [Cryptosporangium aurantiacum]|uniref:Glycosyltransferase, catalytic subunit of cellulose synthase and poly-beta-1,6-N-acetylglucosamine synthase n=1 Tax=Cryptosporangium aurantiacum TaxID=134849 RepID=A0A1M7R1A5_9ACTN|nr:glycosyltransferase [Cryptosporangium aurantiacum]SHN38461.1 Glycosyltransferase, catalytic subunit of cellulose synthase and poly-beta-1,6-N-acetylglucosamine synthase [Cryptosporangium aurantiacum]
MTDWLPDLPTLRAALVAVLDTIGDLVFWYFLAINSSYLLLILLASIEFTQYLRRQSYAGREETYVSPLTPPVSVLVPAYNEELTIVESVRAMLALRYPAFEVVVVIDGSTDRTLARLTEAFDLVRTIRVIPDDVPTRSPILASYAPRAGTPALTVIHKVNGGRADALNTALNASRHPLVCMVDADSLLDPDALLAVAQPFGDDPLRVVATGGVIRVVNGCAVRAGRITEVRAPRQWLPRIQVAEYLRAFLLGRTGWSKLDGLLVISGAFGLFRRDVVVAAGGLDAASIGEDAELVVRLHRQLRRRRERYRILFVGEPVSWTEVPSTRDVLARQRRRWQRGLIELLTKHVTMIGNPRYGRIGTVALPYFLLFEALAPLLELAGVILVPLGLALGVVDPGFAFQLLLVAYGYAILVTFAAIAVEEFAFHRYKRWRDLGVLVLAAVVENFGFRQLTAWWRVQGTYQAIRRTRADWGVMTRAGFEDVPD